MSPTEQRLYSVSQIAKVGSILRDTSSSTDKMEWALGVLDNFRALHVEPLNEFQNTLRARLKKIGLSDADYGAANQTQADYSGKAAEVPFDAS